MATPGCGRPTSGGWSRRSRAGSGSRSATSSWAVTTWGRTGGVTRTAETAMSHAEDLVRAYVARRLHQAPPRLQLPLRRRRGGPRRRGDGRARGADAGGGGGRGRPRRPDGRAPLRDRHRGAGARRGRPRDHPAGADHVGLGARHPRPAPHGVRSGRARPGLAPGDGPGRATRCRVRPRPGLRLRPRGGPVSCGPRSTRSPAMVFEAHSTDYQTEGGARRARRGRLGGAQGRPRPDLRPA